MLRKALFPLVLSLVMASAHAQSRPTFAVDDEQTLTADQTANAMGLLPALQRLRTLTNTSDTAQALQSLRLQQRIELDVTTASLQVDATMGEIDAEIAETRELQNYLTARRQKTIDLLNLASLAIGGSIGTASAALGLTAHTRASGVLGVIAGSATTALSVVGLGVRSHGSGTLEVPSNMLARVFDLPGDPNNVYPPVVAKFMNSPAPNDPDQITRQQRLIKTWTKLGRIPAPDSSGGNARITKVTSRPGDNARLSIGDLDDRQAMLYDFRARVSFMKRDLAALLEGLPRDPLPETGNL
jgi:hypothetical protein